MEDTTINLNGENVKEFGIMKFNERNDELVDVVGVHNFLMKELTGEFYQATTGKVIRIVPKDGKSFTLGELQSVVGGYIELLQTKDNRLMVVNEEGRIMNLPPNLKATKLYKFNDCIFGDVLVCEPKLLNINE